MKERKEEVKPLVGYKQFVISQVEVRRGKKVVEPC